MIKKIYWRIWKNPFPAKIHSLLWKCAIALFCRPIWLYFGVMARPSFLHATLTIQHKTIQSRPFSLFSLLWSHMLIQLKTRDERTILEQVHQNSYISAFIVPQALCQRKGECYCPVSNNVWLYFCRLKGKKAHCHT